MDKLQGKAIRETKGGSILQAMGGFLSKIFTHEGMISIEMMSIYKSVTLKLPTDHVHSTCDM